MNDGSKGVIRFFERSEYRVFYFEIIWEYVNRVIEFIFFNLVIFFGRNIYKKYDRKDEKNGYVYEKKFGFF